VLEYWFLPKGAIAFPPDQWPGGTGGSPVLPKNYEISGLAARQKNEMQQF
jgi:hypothetical protein